MLQPLATQILSPGESYAEPDDGTLMTQAALPAALCLSWSVSRPAVHAYTYIYIHAYVVGTLLIAYPVCSQTVQNYAVHPEKRSASCKPPHSCQMPYCSMMHVFLTSNEEIDQQKQNVEALQHGQAHRHVPAERSAWHSCLMCEPL